MRTRAASFGLAVAILCAMVALSAAAAAPQSAGFAGEAHQHDIAHKQLKRLVREEVQHHEKKERERAMRELQDALRTLAANPELALEEDTEQEADEGHENEKRAFYSVQGKPRGKRTFYSVQGKPRGRRSVNEHEASLPAANEARFFADVARELRAWDWEQSVTYECESFSTFNKHQDYGCTFRTHTHLITVEPTLRTAKHESFHQWIPSQSFAWSLLFYASWVYQQDSQSYV